MHTISEDTPLEKIVEMMERYRIKRVPVLRGKKVVGIVTRANLMHAMVSLARGEPKAATSDAAIRQELLSELKSEKWAVASMINVVVRGGVVELWGMIVDDRQREALIVAAENVRGVKEVKDHLTWVEPTSGVVIEPRDEVNAR
jgi:CBS domain-containing protein